MLYPARWKDYQKHFTLDDKAIRTLLGEILDIRNTLAHFRDDLTPSQRSKLRFCAKWFERNSPVFRESSSYELGAPGDHLLRDANTATTPNETDGLADAESRYTRLSAHLQDQNADRVRLNLEEIEGIIGGQLPPSARRHRSWWANDWVGDVQSKYWLQAGWRVASVNLTDQVITFIRLDTREALYISFFSRAVRWYSTLADYSVKTVSPSGASWHTVGGYRSDSYTVATLNFSFAKSSRFRVELYIDSGDASVNKNILDTLQANQESIEKAIRANIDIDEEVNRVESKDLHALTDASQFSWERLDERRASRVALTVKGNITDDWHKLVLLFGWAGYAMVAFQHVMTPYMAERGFEYSSR